MDRPGAVERRDGRRVLDAEPRPDRVRRVTGCDDGVGDDVSVVVAVHGAGGEVTRAPVYEVAGEPRTQTAEVDPGGSGQASASLRDFVALP